MNVRVLDGLARSPSHIQPNVQSIRLMVPIQAFTDLPNEVPQRALFFRSQREEIRLMSTGHDQRMTGAEGISIRERDGVLVRSNESAACQFSAEGTRPREMIAESDASATFRAMKGPASSL